MSYVCERCGKVVEESDRFGSGRFCSRACANSRTMSAEIKEKIRSGVTKVTICSCDYCNREFLTLTARASHERLCPQNPHRLNMSSASLELRLQQPVVLWLPQQGKKTKIELDITYAELEQYRQTHPVCEICGRSVAEATKWDSKFAVKNLCIDHDHRTGTFRGLLCQLCNRQLGWVEKHKDSISKYLDCQHRVIV